MKLWYSDIFIMKNHDLHGYTSQKDLKCPTLPMRFANKWLFIFFWDANDFT